MIVCRTLGPVEVLLDGSFAPAELLWKKNLALLVYLARSPRRGRAREHLMALLWAEKPEAAARHSLNEALRVIRRAAGEDAVDTSAGQIRLAPEAVRLDIERLDELIGRRGWCEASGLIAGEFLEGFAVPGATEFEDWLAAERVAWRRRSVEVLVRCVDTMLDAGRTQEAYERARWAATLDSHSDQAVRTLMRTLALLGERAAALECYEDFEARLREEFGSHPAAETTSLAELVRQERPARPPRHAERADHGSPDMLPPLVGRGSELMRLLETAGQCRLRRQATAIILEGDAGTGKTRLLEELLARLRLDGATVSAVRSVEADRAEPWSGVRALARGGLLRARGIAGAPGPALASFAGEIPEWAERFRGTLDETPLPPGRALCEVLRPAVDEQPIFLAVDDAANLDRESLLGLTSVLRDLPAAPVGVILTISGRDPSAEIDQLRTRIGRDLSGLVVSLHAFGVAELAELARRILPSFNEMEIDRVVRRVGTDSAGVPLLAVELLRAVALGLDLGSTSGAWPAPFHTLDQTLPGDLPDAIVAAIRVGVRRLTPTEREVLAAASVLGDRVTPEQLAEAVELPLADVTQALDQLEWHRWMVSEPRGYGFVARIVRQVVDRDMLTPGRRRRILQRLA